MLLTTYINKNLKTTKNLENIKLSALHSILSNKEYDEDFIETNFRPKLTKEVEDTKEFRDKNEQYIANALVKFKRMKRYIDEFKENNPLPVEEYYTTFRIPKTSGGTRKITAPTDDLKLLLSDISNLFKQTYILEHDAAFAYVPKRSTKDALMVHQANNSQWFVKIDLKNFFPSFTKEFIIETLNRLYPIYYVDDEILRHVVEVSLYEGGLPQGSPLSPLLSNLCMIYFDHAMDLALREYDKQTFYYTRYADDILISSKYQFNYKKIVKLVTDVLKESAPVHSVNKAKTRYGSRAGRNWNLGLMLNKDNKITIGHNKKRRLKAMIFSFLSDCNKGNPWTQQETQEFIGLLNYGKQIEPEYWNRIIARLENKVGVTIRAMRELYSI